MPSGQAGVACRIQNGVVNFRGVVVNSGFSGGFTTFVTIPEMFRPSSPRVFSALANTTAIRALRALDSGGLQAYYSVNSLAWLYLDPVQYPLY